MAADRWPTPFYLLAWEPVEAAVSKLARIRTAYPVRHWLSVKTQPVKPLLRRWAERGWGAEVVSEYELRAALAEGFRPEAVLVNGVGKHTWLNRFIPRRLNVNVDSVTEARGIAQLAYDLQWNVGLRLHMRGEFDPDDPTFGGQFGMSFDEAREALALLRHSGVSVVGLHFHLRSNVESASAFGDALEEAAQFCESSRWSPLYIDTGGGLPDPGVTEGVDTAYFDAFGDAITDFARSCRTIREVWMEHGRFVTGGSGVLVLRVIDLKDRPECRYLIFDGGRTNHALISDWERHSIFLVPERRGQTILTTVAGPTCMAFDRLDRIPLPSDVTIGDLVVWTHAGAYHIPWETRFSRGTCSVIWAENHHLCLIRHEESFADWWGQWV